MQINFRPYRRKSDGQLMLYINRSNGVSVGLSPSSRYSPYGRGITEGMRQAVEAALDVFYAYSKPFTGKIPVDAVDCGKMFWLVVTDTADVGGMNVGQDGAYLIRDKRILRCKTYTEKE